MIELNDFSERGVTKHKLNQARLKLENMKSDYERQSNLVDELKAKLEKLGGVDDGQPA
ncbi:hypothetical protein [Rhizobium sp. BK176]|uniref:hypothetical protein n=1 Tax=Rhizobium sp. BK176 TaxID=2587071 RepID=UPI002167C674|nr:hypothetical protein [Rhizobium sp. BK176]MCS4088897.1 hypothetical protein [Rhizobium sp. BK176]